MPKPLSTWFPFYFGDYAADTIGLTLAQHGAYILTLGAYWRRAGPLPDAEARAIMGPEADVILARFFTQENGHWRQKRADIELSRAAGNQANLSQRGRLGNAVRWARDATGIAGRSNGDPTAIPGDPPSPSPSPSQLQSQEDTHAPKSGAMACHQAIDQWNLLAKETGLPAVQRQSSARLKALRLRLEECGGSQGWAACLAKVRDSPFLLGKTNGNGHAGFSCTFDWLLKPANFIKVTEGNYDERKGTSGSWQGESDRLVAAIHAEPDADQE